MADRMERVWSLVALLRHSNEPLTFADIRGRLGSHMYPDGEPGRQRFEQDKLLLREEGIDLVTHIPFGERGATTYRIDDSSFLPDLGLTDDERIALELAAAAVRFDDATWVRDAGWKLGGTMAEPPLAVTFERSPVLGDLFEATRTAATATFDYRSAADLEPRRREVEPHGLLSRSGWWYLVAVDRADGKRKNFRVDRVVGEVVVGEAGEVERPDEIDLPEALPTAPWLLGDDDEVTATVRVGPAFAERARAEAGDVEVVEHDDGWVELELVVRNRSGLRAWVLGMQEHAELTGPPELRDELVAWLEAIAG